MDEKTTAEKVGRHFDLETMLDVRQRTRQAIRDIAAQIVPGMLEERGREIAMEVLTRARMRRGWHAVHVRFGRNTLKPFGAPSDPGVMLGEHDLFFIDIGPVWGQLEGDGGDTFVVGSDPEMHRIKTDVRRVFDDARRLWLDRGLNGAGLYEFASGRAKELGWELNLAMNGHRLADFPHAVLHEGALADAHFRPSPNLWVLEIQIRHPTQPYSAFYEDLLLEDATAD